MSSSDPGPPIRATITRTQIVVLAFFAVAWLTIFALLLTRPAVYDEALRLDRGDRPQEFGLVSLISAFIALMSVGVIRRWRWTFWLVAIAFLAGIVRVPVSALEVAGGLPRTLPDWYIAYQATLGVAQFIIGVLMIVGYRKGGPWGAF